MHPAKLLWAARALLYKCTMKRVGNLTYIGRPCFIEGRRRISIGTHTRIFPGIRMEAIGTGEIKIGDNVAIEQNVHLTSGGILTIGDHSTIVANACITNINHEYTDIEKSVLDQGYTAIDTVIGEGCFIGYGAVVLPGTILGKHCIVGANAVVKGDFPDYSVIVGMPGKIVKRYDADVAEWKNMRKDEEQ